MWVGVKSDLIAITRKTDSITDWIGDCGGFMEALKTVGNLIVFSYQAYAFKQTLAENLVRFVPSQSENSDISAKKKLKKR